jgi:hypothetical protein
VIVTITVAGTVSRLLFNLASDGEEIDIYWRGKLID